MSSAAQVKHTVLKETTGGETAINFTRTMPSLSFTEIKGYVEDYLRDENVVHFIETGTYAGQTTRNMAPHFNKVYTIELSESLHRQNVENTENAPNITFLHGDSSDVFPELLPDINDPAVFWLDGHWSCGHTARGCVDVPLLDELASIRDCFKPKAIVLIDDVRLFGDKNSDGWDSITLDKVMLALRERVERVEFFPSHLHPKDRLVLCIKPRDE